MTNVPSGIVTFLFTDIEGSTKLAQEFPERLPLALEKHHSILSEIIESNNGFVFEIIGDAFYCAFENAIEALKAAYEAQVKFNSEKCNEAQIKVRMGIHSGVAEWNGSLYMGYITLARTQRVMSTAYGEQILISNEAYELVKENFNVTNQEIRNKMDRSEISFRDLGERRLKDVIQPIRLYQVASPALRKDFPPLNTLDARPNNLPVQLTSFIGRKEEMKQVKALLKQTHLLTLTGPGGAGKTRLALQLAAEIIDDFANGVWFVEFASLTQPALLPQVVLKVFELQEETERTLEKTLCDYLKEKEILIILDNCEHMIEACATLAEKLLGYCPKLKVIATSREALRCTGEKTHRVLSLEIPNIEKEISAEKLSQYESVMLFLERAVAVNSNFRVVTENAPALAQICHQLDGIPLAIELAAAKIRVLSVEEILEKLNDRFGLLTGGSRTALPRQQTLLALIDWSYDLLSDKEKLLLQRLSIFAGGWTLEAASEVCSDKQLKRNEILDVLTKLVDKSLVIPTEKDGKVRYNTLETIHHYAVEKLVDNSELQKNHFDYFLKLTEQSEIQLTGAEQIKWLKIIENELANIRSALKWSVKIIPDSTLRMASAMGEFWSARSYYSEGLDFLLTALGEMKNSKDIYKAKALHLAGLFSFRMGKNVQAKSFLQEGLELSQEIGYSTGIGHSLLTQGTYELNFGHYKKTKELFENSLSKFREFNVNVGVAKSLVNLGVLNRFLGDYEKSEKYYEEALEIYRELNNLQQIALTTFHIGYIAYYKDELEKSRKILEENLPILKKLGDKYYSAKSIQQLGVISYDQGDYDKSRKLNEDSLKIFREIGYKNKIPHPLFYLAKIFFKQGNREKGKRILKESISISREVGSKILLSDCIYILADIVFDQGKEEAATKLIAKNESMRKHIGQFSITLDTEVKLNLSKLKSKLGNEKFKQLWKAGLSMTFDEAVEFALGELD